MRLHLASLALAVASLSAPVGAASHKEAPMMKEPTEQQSKMGECNKKAEGMKGDARKEFMKGCLSAKKSTQQDKMKSCNAEASDKKGEERKAFMKSCLSR